MSSALLERPTSATLSIDTRPRGVPLLLLLGILTAIASLSIDMYLPALPAIAVDLHAAPGLLEATLAAFFAGFAVGQLAYGPLSDRVGRRPPLIGGLALYTLASIVCATAATPGCSSPGGPPRRSAARRRWSSPVPWSATSTTRRTPPACSRG